MRRPALRLLLATALVFGAWPFVSAVGVSAAVTNVLPDLAVIAPYDFRVVIHSSGQRRLRFSTVVVNLGPGPFQMYGYDEDGKAAIGDGLLIRQQILRSNGTFTQRNTSATMFWAGDGHNHFHAAGMQLIRLEKLDGTEIRRTRKTGFCFLDSYVYGSTKPSRYNSANYVCQPAPNGTVPMGVSVRWGDIYKYSIAHQWIDLTGVPNGDYKVKVVADPPFYPGGRFLEANEANNRGWTKIRISGTSVSILSRTARP